MSHRFTWVLQNLENTNLIELAAILARTTEEAISEGKIPHMDPAVRMICFQIAISGNGDNHDRDEYKKLYDYCVAMQAGAPNYEVLGLPPPTPPEYKAS